MRNLIFKYLNIYIFTLCIVCISACARMGNPDGGPYDEDPPKIVSTSPEFGAVNTQAKKIVLNFDENVKLDGASDKVIVSPPQLEQPDIEASGRKITVSLVDSLKPGMTYTIDFGDAILDNNEGNPMGDYAFTFSTGDRIDTMQVSGYVLNAEDLEPIKGISVGLYSLGEDSTGVNFPDSVFRTQTFERISRTDGSGHFVIKGIAPGHYRVFALQDQDQNYVYSQKSEQIAFTDRIIVPSCRPDMRVDTLWHDSIHYDSLINVHYTHFLPDDITLLAFLPAAQDRHLLKTERLLPNKITAYFSAPSDSIPVIEGLNFDASDAFVTQRNTTNDTITYWIRDSLLYNRDTLSVLYTYMANDTNGVLLRQTDTLDITPKVNRERREKLAKQEWEKYEKEWRKEHKHELRENPDMQVPPMPVLPLEVKFSSTTMSPDRNIDITMPEPIAVFDTTKIHFSEKIDSLYYPRPYLLVQNENDPLSYCFYAEWRPECTYELLIDSAAITSMYGLVSDEIKKTVKIRKLGDFGTLFVSVGHETDSVVVELLNGSGKPTKRQLAKDGRADFYFITPGTYYLRAFIDQNGNGIWDPGDYDTHLAPEPVYYNPTAIPIKADWEISQSWNITALPIYKQKPEKITKQKADKKKETSHTRNEERLKKLGRK